MKMKQTLKHLKEKLGDLIESDWDRIEEAYQNHKFSITIGIKIALDGSSMNNLNSELALSYYPMPKTEVKTDKVAIDEKQKKLFETDGDGKGE